MPDHNVLFGASLGQWNGADAAGAADLQLEIVRMLLAAGATLADTDRNGITVAGRINSQALRDALAAGQL